MITLQYHQSQCGPIYHFHMKGDFSVLKDNFKIIAYPNNPMIDNFYFVTQQTLDNINYLVGNVYNKMIDEQGFSQCSIEFHDNKLVFQNQYCTISIIKETTGNIQSNAFHSIVHFPTFLRTIYTDLSYSLGLIQRNDTNVITNNQLVTYTNDNVMTYTTSATIIDSFNTNYIDTTHINTDYWKRINSTITSTNTIEELELEAIDNNIILLPPKKELIPNFYYYQNSYLLNKNKNIINPADTNPLDFHKDVFDDAEFIILPSKES